MMSAKFAALLKDIRACTICGDLPLGPRPILQISPSSKVLIVGQAPGRVTHNKGIPFDDPSGDRLRMWLNVDRDVFYDPQQFAILPMGFCYPGVGKSGDLPPRAECAPAWRERILEHLDSEALTIIIGRYAIDWHAPKYSKLSVTEAVKNSSAMRQDHIILPHPSPRNNRWLKQNPWFDKDIIPALQTQVKRRLSNLR